MHLFVFRINLGYLRAYIKVCRIYGYCIRGVRYILAPFCMLSGKKAGIGGQGRLITYSD